MTIEHTSLKQPPPYLYSYTMYMFMSPSSEVPLYMYMCLLSYCLLLPLESVISSSYACIPAYGSLTFMHVSVCPSATDCLLFSPSSSVAVRDENKDEDSDDDNKENEVPQYDFPYTHTHILLHVLVHDYGDLAVFCFIWFSLLCFIVSLCVHVRSTSHVIKHAHCA